MQTAAEMRQQVVDRATTDQDFRARLLEDPTGAIGEALDVTMPTGLKVEVHEESADTAHIVLPPPSQLSEADMRHAAGGLGDAGDPDKPPKDGGRTNSFW